NPETGDRGTHREPGGTAAAFVHSAITRDAGDAFPGPAGAEAGENAGRLSSGERAGGRSGSDAAAGTGAWRVFAGYSSWGKPAGAENAAERGTTAGRGGGWREISGDCRHDCGRRYGADHRPEQEAARLAAAEDRVVREPPSAQSRFIK